MNPECPKCCVPMALKHSYGRHVWYCPYAWSGSSCTQVKLIDPPIDNTALLSKLDEILRQLKEMTK